MNPHLTIPEAFTRSIQPIVLVGGKSSRFGRDKLNEPLGFDGHVLVQRPIHALRAVFGQRVRLVGACSNAILSLADGVIVDQHPGLGPIGGIVSALRAADAPVFVLAGDMPNVTSVDVQTILLAAQNAPDAWAVIAATDRRHPCFGVYRAAALTPLEQCLNEHRYTLRSAIPDEHLKLVPCSEAAAANVNTPSDLMSEVSLRIDHRKN